MGRLLSQAISNKTLASDLDGSELFYGVQGGSAVKVSSAQMSNYAAGLPSNQQPSHYTLQLTDWTIPKLIEMTSGGANNLTIPPHSSVPFPIGTTIPAVQNGAGLTTVVAGSGVTLRSSAGVLTSPGQYNIMFFRKIAINEWYVFNGSPGQDLSAYALKATTINGMAISANRIIPTNFGNKRSGLYYPLVTGTVPANVVHTADTLRAWRFVVPETFTMSGFVTEVTTNIGASSYRIGIYTDSGGYPNSLVANSDTGAIDSAAAAAVRTSTFSSNVTLTPGYYWLAFNNSHGPTFKCWTASSLFATNGTTATAGLVPLVGWSVSLSYQAMPSTFTAGATGLSTSITASACPIVTALIV